MPDNALPRSFEDFNEARKLGFLAAKEYKERGGKLAGCLCSYTPLEVIDAAGMAAIGLCGMSDEAIPDAETVLPKNLCPLIKGTYGFALTEKCPYTYFSDIIVGETTCDGKKKMYELLADLKDVHVLHLPQSQARSYAADIWHEEVKLFASELERRFGVRIDDGKLRDAARLRNRYRRALVRLYELQRSEPPAMRGVELMSTLLASTFSFDVETFVGKLEALADERERAYAAGERPVAATAKRILLTGCPSGGVINKVGKVIEEHGGVIVCLDDCSGERANRLLGHDAERRPHRQYGGNGPRLPRRRRGGGGAASLPHVQRGIVPCAAAHGGRGHPVPQAGNRLLCRGRRPGGNPVGRVHRDAVATAAWWARMGTHGNF